MKGGARRNVAWLAGAGAFALAVMAVLHHEEILVQYHLLRLRGEPGYLHEVLPCDEHSPERAAIERFLETRPGKNALFREYADVVLKSVFAERGDLAATAFEAVIWNGAERASYVERFPGRDFGGHGILIHADPPERLVVINHLVSHLEGEEFRLPDHPALGFEVMRGAKTRNTPLLGAHRKILPEYQAVTCRMLREPSSKVEILLRLLKTASESTPRYLWALGELGAEARTAVPVIQEYLDHQTEWVRFEADRALRRIQRARGDAVEF